MRSIASSCSASHGWSFLATVSTAFLLTACEVAPEKISVPVYVPPNPPDNFVCVTEATRACVGNKYYSCIRDDEFLEAQMIDCGVDQQVCILEIGCSVCRADTRRCVGETVETCIDGLRWEATQECDVAGGFRCDTGSCESMCELSKVERSYAGCEFFAVDLDNAALSEIDNASAQQFAVAVSNPQNVTTRVTVEINRAPVGEPADIVQVASVLVPPGDLEYLKLDRREVDGSTVDGVNDGTHTALTSNAYRITSKHPIIAYQFNPFENVNVFSNDASLLLPTSAVGSDYTVVTWPQTIANSDDPEQDFDSSVPDEDLRTFLTIVGTANDTQVTLRMGPDVVRVVGLGANPDLGPLDPLAVTLNAFDVLNLETQGFNADFTGSTVESNRPIVVFVGSEASDAPIFATYATRQCCADHLEEQLFANTSLGNRYIVARMPRRTATLNAAFNSPVSVAEVDEPEWIRVVAVSPGTTRVTTTLPPPNDEFALGQGAGEILRADQDVLIEADRPVAIMQVLASQGVTGIPRDYPGGDPSIIAVPPLEQYRTNYIFLTPDKYGFDFVIITAPSDADVQLDGEDLIIEDESSSLRVCTKSRADGLPETTAEPSQYVIYRCQLSFPEVTAAPNSRVLDGVQNDGVHEIASTLAVGVVVYGFDRFVSYAYVGGLDQKVLN